MNQNDLFKFYASFNTICRNTMRLVLLYAYEHEEDFKNWVKEKIERGMKND